ncbi:MAG: ABC transporter permease subunit [Oscillospiraceae bacterium]
MKDFTTKNKPKLQMLFAILFWIAIWQGASMLIGQSLLLASPFSAFTALLRLFTTHEFWLSVDHSFLRIVSGFLLGLRVGLLLAVFSAAASMVRILLAPFMLTVRSVPVASFIILALLWLKNAGNLAVLISFLMVLPVVYGNVLEGIINTDKKLLQMAKVYNMPFYKKLLYIYLPDVQPFFVSACTAALGLCWKSGVAAEVIGITENSIGGGLYNAKLYFATDEVLAWTAVIVLLSFTFERIFLSAIKAIYAYIKQRSVNI